MDTYDSVVLYTTQEDLDGETLYLYNIYLWTIFRTDPFLTQYLNDQ